MNRSKEINTVTKAIYKEPTEKMEGSEIEKLASLFEILKRIDQRQKRNGENN